MIISRRLAIVSLLTATRFVQGLGFTTPCLPRCSLAVTTTSFAPKSVTDRSRSRNNCIIDNNPLWSSTHSTPELMPSKMEKFMQPIDNESNNLPDTQDYEHSHDTLNLASRVLSITALVLPLLGIMALPANAATGGVVQNALLAYVHYASILVCVAALMLQRCMVQANMSPEQEDDLFKTEVVLGLGSVALLVSGYFRIDMDKGLGFYSHEPWFWIKIILAGVWGGSSMFPSTIIFNRYLERTVTKKDDNPAQLPISTALAARMNQVLNAELTALLFIPLTATLMARGVGYSADLPWQVGVALSTVAWLGLSYKYAKDALTWKDDPVEPTSPTQSISTTSRNPELSKQE